MTADHPRLESFTCTDGGWSVRLEARMPTSAASATNTAPASIRAPFAASNAADLLKPVSVFRCEERDLHRLLIGSIPNVAPEHRLRLVETLARAAAAAVLAPLDARR